MDPQERRDPLFDALRAEMDSLQTPPAVEQALLQAFAQQFPRRRWYHAIYQVLAPRRRVLGGGLAAALALLVLAPVLAPLLHTPGGAPTPAARQPSLARADDGGLFIALDSLERIEEEPAPRMVDTEVPRSTLAELGVPLTPDNAGDSVKAELLLAADGEALALRLPAVPDFQRAN